MTLPGLATLQGLCSTHRIGLTWPFQVDVAGQPWTIATDGQGLLAIQGALALDTRPRPSGELLEVARTYIERAATMRTAPADLAQLRAWCRTRFHCARCGGTGLVQPSHRVRGEDPTCSCDRGEGLWRYGNAGRLANRRMDRRLVERWLSWLPEGAAIAGGVYGPEPEQPVVFAGDRWLVLIMPLRAVDVANAAGGDLREPVLAIGPTAEVG